MMFKGKKINTFFIFFIFLVGLNFLGIFVLVNQRQAFNSAQARFSLENSLKKEGLGTNFFQEMVLLDKAFPNQQGVIDLISSINKYESQFEKLSISFETEGPKEDKEFGYLPFVLEVWGDSARVTEFLEKLLRAPYLLEITSLRIKQKEGSGSQVEAIVKANLYVSELFDQK